MEFQVKLVFKQKKLIKKFSKPSCPNCKTFFYRLFYQNNWPVPIMEFNEFDGVSLKDLLVITITLETKNLIEARLLFVDQILPKIEEALQNLQFEPAKIIHNFDVTKLKQKNKK